MHGLDPQLLMHKINKEGRNQKDQEGLEDEEQIKQEIQNFMEVSFIKPIQHPTWLAKIESVKKKKDKFSSACTSMTLAKYVGKMTSYYQT